MTEIASGGVSLVGIPQNEFMLTMRLASGITRADEGKPVALDTSANNTVKLAGDGDVIIGNLKIVNNRLVEGILVGTVEFKGGFRWPFTGTVVRGNSVVGSATAGSVKAGTNARTLVVAVTPTHADVVII